MREDFIAPVGFAHEPAERRRHWWIRIFTAVFLVFVVWLFWTKVWHAQDTGSPTIGRQPASELPGPK